MFWLRHWRRETHTSRRLSAAVDAPACDPESADILPPPGKSRRLFHTRMSRRIRTVKTRRAPGPVQQFYRSAEAVHGRRRRRASAPHAAHRQTRKFRISRGAAEGTFPTVLAILSIPHLFSEYNKLLVDCGVVMCTFGWITAVMNAHAAHPLRGKPPQTTMMCTNILEPIGLMLLFALHHGIHWNPLKRAQWYLFSIWAAP